MLQPCTSSMLFLRYRGPRRATAVYLSMLFLWYRGPMRATAAYLEHVVPVVQEAKVWPADADVHVQHVQVRL